MRIFFACFIALACVSLASCVTFMDAVSEEPIQPDPSRRSFGNYWDDKRLATIVRVNLNKADPRFDELNINVYAFNAVVLLTGQAPDAHLRELAADTARKINNVRQVYNEITVDSTRGLGGGIQDKWLGTRLKTKLMAYKDIQSGRVKVFTENRTVYLMGLLTHEQADRVTEVVRNDKGVRKVVRAIEYID